MGKKAVHDQALDFIALKLGGARPADQTRACAQHRNTDAFGRIGRQQTFLGRAALLDELGEAAFIATGAAIANAVRSVQGQKD